MYATYNLLSPPQRDTYTLYISRLPLLLIFEATFSSIMFLVVRLRSLAYSKKNAVMIVISLIVPLIQSQKRNTMYPMYPVA
jgi:hypothetical protein